jgi:diguanylate cyclase (GGDEF)-like protein/PAS domain S-box-containing protein
VSVPVQPPEIEALVEGANEAFISADSKCLIRTWNASAEQTFGWSRSEVIGRSMIELIFPAELHAEFYAALSNFLASGEDPHFNRRLELELVNRQGERFAAEIRISAVWRAGEVVFHAFCHDASGDREAAEAERRLSALVEGSRDAIFSVDSQGRITSWNESAAGLYGYDREEAVGMSARELAAPGSEKLVGELAEQLAAGEVVRGLRTQGRRKDGEVIEVSVTISPIRSKDGEVIGATAMARDLSPEREVEMRSQRLDALIQASDDAIVTKSPEGLITSWNSASERLFGYPAAEAVGQPIGLIIPESRRSEEHDLLRRVLDGEEVTHFETERLTRDGRVIPVSLILSPLRDAQGQVVAISSITEDISERKRYEGELQYLADHDPLTGLYNRRRFQRELTSRLAGEQPSGAVVLLDIDHFKVVNDTYSHQIGDEVLRQVSGLLRQRAGSDDLTGHFGGDEFALLLPESSNSAARQRAEKLLRSIHEEISSELKIEITASAGIALFGTAEQAGAETLLVRADMALFEAKESGGEQTVVYDSERDTRMQWAQRIRAALDEGRFLLYAQPIVSLQSGETAQHELLLRMRDDGGELIEPGPFLATAERLGLIGEIDRWVIGKAIELAAEGEPVEINLSGRGMNDPDLLELIAAEIKRHKVDPAKLIFEITETRAIANLSQATKFAERLRRLGCRFALDDFGTGFGSFSYLKHLPVSVIKIDGEFIRDLASSKINQQIVKAIVSVAGVLGQETVAEWVGDKETYELLRSYGVNYAQGNLIGTPQPLGSSAEDSGPAADSSQAARWRQKVRPHLPLGR